ncbi:MAG: S41 family peptidase [Terriglobia bacterium]
MSRRARTTVIGLSLVVVFTVALGGVLGRTAGDGAYKQLTVFSEVLTRIQTDYVEDPNLQRVTRNALRGLLESLDPYSGYLSPKEYDEYKVRQTAPAEGEVGLVLSKRFGLVSVVTVLPESPAARAGLVTGDILESIAGFSSREMSVEQAYLFLEGEPGTSVRVNVVRQARAEPREIDLVRARLRPAQVLSDRLEENIAYMKIAGFESGRAQEVRAALERLRGRGLRKLVLDLRDAATGEMEEAVETARLLLPRGMIAYLEGQQYQRHQFTAESEKALWEGPLTVLINNGTAGAAEVVAAAVLDNGRGEVIGQRSYGVGSVQKVIPLENGAALILSVAKVYRPSGTAIQDEAVTPTLEVELTGERQVGPYTLPPPGDPVLLKALEVLRAQETAQPERESSRKAA